MSAENATRRLLPDNRRVIRFGCGSSSHVRCVPAAYRLSPFTDHLLSERDLPGERLVIAASPGLVPFAGRRRRTPRAALSHRSAGPRRTSLTLAWQLATACGAQSYIFIIARLGGRSRVFRLTGCCRGQLSQGMRKIQPEPRAESHKPASPAKRSGHKLTRGRKGRLARIAPPIQNVDLTAIGASAHIGEHGADSVVAAAVAVDVAQPDHAARIDR